MSLVGNTFQDRLINIIDAMDMAGTGMITEIYLSANIARTTELKGSYMSCRLIKLTLYLKSNMMKKRD